MRFFADPRKHGEEEYVHMVFLSKNGSAISLRMDARGISDFHDNGGRLSAELIISLGFKEIPSPILENFIAKFGKELLKLAERLQGAGDA